jgi:hypothetical protein
MGVVLVATPLAEAFVRVRADTSGFRREAERDASDAGDKAGRSFGGAFTRSLAAAARGAFSAVGRETVTAATDAGSQSGRVFGEQFTRDAAGRLRDSRGRFVTAGEDAGGGFGEGFTRDANGRLRDARGKFVSEGGAAGDGFGQAFRSGALRQISGLGATIAAGVAIGPAVIPVVAAATAALVGLGATAGAAFAAIGVGSLAFQGVGDAVSALDAAQKDAAKSAASVAGAQNAVASAADGVRSAEASLANTRIQVAEANRRAAQQVADAEQQLTDAQRDARDVVLELDAARQQATRRLADLNQSVKENALSQRQANLDIAEAKQRLDKVLADPKASAEQREQARITYERQVLQQQELQRRGKELASDAAKANKAGVEGSSEVLAVRERIAQANERVKAAERAVADARRAQTQQQVQGQFQLAQAAQAVASAQRALRQATVQAGVSGSAATDKLREAMAGLSPAGRQFAKFIFGLKDEFRGLRDAAAQGLLPGVQSALQGLLPFLPQLERFVGQVAAKMGELAVRASQALQSPFWRDFFALIGREAVPSLERLFQITGNVAKGFAGIAAAFTPFNAELGGGIVGLTQKFADFGAGLSTSTGFQQFLDYLRTNGPVVVDLFGNLATLAGKLVVGLAPLGAGSLGGINLLVSALAGLSPDVLAKIAVGIAAISAAATVYNVAAKGAALATNLWAAAQKVGAAATKVWTGIQAAFNLVLAANPLGIAVIAIAALVAALVVAYNRSDRFRAIVQTAWAAIQRAVSVAWEQYIRPALTALAGFFTDKVAPAAVFLWRGVIVPAFKGIAGAVSFAWESIIKPAVSALVAFFRNVIAPAALFLWRNVIVPAWQGIQLAISVAWAAIQVIFGLIKIGLKILGAAFSFWKDRVVLPVFNTIKTVISAWWSGVKFIFGLVKGYLETVLGPVFRWLRDKVITPVWNGIKATISNAWNGIKGIFNALGGFLTTYVVPAFKRGVDAIGKAWQGIQAAAKAPVKFVVETVLNKGILAGYNKIAKLFNVKPDNVQIPLPKGFARGGVLPGYTPGRDVHRFYSASGGMLDLSGGEAIIRPEGTRALGKGWVDGVNQAARTGGVAGVRSFLSGGYAQGGILGGGQGDGLGSILSAARKKASDVITGAKGFLTDPLGTLRQVSGNLINLIPGKDSGFGQALRGLPSKVLSLALSRLNVITGAGSALAGAAGRALSKTSPFGGSAGMMRVLRGPFPSLPLISGFRPGSVTLSGNRSYHASDRAVDVPPIRAVAEHIFRNYRAVTRELITPFQEFNLLNGRPHTYTGAVWRQHNFQGGNAHNHWAARLGGIMPRLPFGSYDSGGHLPTGLSLAYNGTGRPEPVGHGLTGGITVVNYGVIGSQGELDGWLVSSVTRLRRERKLT